MKQLLDIAVSFMLAASLFPGAAFAGEGAGSADIPSLELLAAFEDEGAYVPDEMLVVLADADAGNAASREDAQAVVDSIDEVQDAEVSIEADGETGAMLVVEVERDADLGEVAAAVEALPEVEFVQPNYTYRLMDADERVTLETGAADGGAAGLGTYEPLSWSVNDEYAPNQYYLNSVNAYDAWDYARAEGKVTVAVLDTGVLANHEDLQGNILSSYMCDVYARLPEGQIAYSLNPTGDKIGHGTHVAGIIAAQANNTDGIAGVSYNAGILPIKIFDSSSSPTATTETMTRAYSYLLGLVDAGKVDNLRIVNMSLGSYDEEDNDIALERAINRARDSYGIVTVCAGGNGWKSGDPEVVSGDHHSGEPRTDKVYPGDFDACVSVTALTATGSNASYSDYNACKDISAPGNSVLSTEILGNASARYNKSDAGGYNIRTGTSMAAPIVSGILALLWADNPDLTVDQALEAIYQTANPVDNWDRPSTGSHGAIDAYEAPRYARIHYGDGVDISGGGDIPDPEPTLTKGQWIRLKGATAYDTMQDIVKHGWTGTGGTVVVATGSGFADALSATGVAGLENAPILITDGKKLSAQTRSELQRLRPKKIIIAGGKAVVLESVASEIKAATGVTPTRLKGAKASDTAVALNAAPAYVGKWSDTAILATSKGYQDALSAAPIAYAQRMPVFLVDDKNTISAATLKAMKDCGIRKVMVVGGKAVVSDFVRNTLRAAGFSVDTRKGATAYDTSKAVAEWGMSLGMTADKMGVATGKGYQDALCGAALCGRNGSVIVLADSSNIYTCRAIALDNKESISMGYVYGGRAAVTDTVMEVYERASGCPLSKK